MTPWGGILRRNLQQYNYTNNIVRKQIIDIHKIPSLRSKEFSPAEISSEKLQDGVTA